MINQFGLKSMPLTMTLIIASVLVTLFTSFGRNPTTDFFLMYLPYIMNGEVWRVLTPVLLHFSLLHIVFNMLWTYDLGQVIETRRGTLHLGLLVVITGLAGNIGEYWWSGPIRFGGMSGVVYGLLGYVWIQGVFNPRAGLALHKPIVIMMLVWFVLCWMGVVGNIANMAHTMGLVSGVVLGWIFSIGKLAGTR